MNVLEQKPNHITFQFINNPETFKIYPFEFQILLSYTLRDFSLEVNHKIINTGKKVLPFQIGGHPAFNLHAFPSIQLEEHFIEFSIDEQNIRHLINNEGYFTGETETIPLKDKKLYLNDKFFEKDAIIFKNIESSIVSLKNLKNNHGIHLEIFNTENSESFYLGIWKPVGADFVCIEPWIGCADKIYFQDDFTQKELYKKIDPNLSDEFIYSIQVF
jgi:galactose mutarotase-like enzyme